MRMTKTTLEYCGAPRKGAYSPYVGAIGNGALFLMATRYLLYPSGQVFTQSTGIILAILVSAMFLIVGLVASILDIFVFKRRLLGLLGIVLSIMPLPVFLILFEVITQVKRFSFH